ncbi:hypothetical protein GQ44DRAFT_705330 [Phaeosphaeriaceae sp. PMI808]|nr:hypothetical protein GQ44DRAFT_705330 [Phaeosphaeriaceae sp. PMI808]
MSDPKPSNSSSPSSGQNGTAVNGDISSGNLQPRESTTNNAPRNQSGPTSLSSYLPTVSREESAEESRIWNSEVNNSSS